jgi:hypothetical protein
MKTAKGGSSHKIEFDTSRRVPLQVFYPVPDISWDAETQSLQIKACTSIRLSDSSRPATQEAADELKKVWSDIVHKALQDKKSKNAILYGRDGSCLESAFAQAASHVLKKIGLSADTLQEQPLQPCQWLILAEKGRSNPPADISDPSLGYASYYIDLIPLFGGSGPRSKLINSTVEALMERLGDQCPANVSERAYSEALLQTTKQLIQMGEEALVTGIHRGQAPRNLKFQLDTATVSTGALPTSTATEAETVQPQALPMVHIAGKWMQSKSIVPLIRGYGTEFKAFELDIPIQQ